VIAASQDDPYCSQRSAISLARDWGSRFADAGAVGHINAESDLGDWPLGERLLEQLMRGYGPLPREIPVRNLVPALPWPASSPSARRH
jgi:hypothetical protein